RTTIAPYKFRWQSDFSSQMGNWGVHYFDTVRWLTGERAPVAVSAVCGKKFLDDDRDIPDNTLVNFEFASGMLLSFTLSETTGVPIMPRELCLAGNKASVYASQNGYEVVPAKPGQFQKKVQSSLKPVARSEKKGRGTDELIRNFLDCVKSREKSWCSLEEGHLSTTMSHIANIALKVGKRLEWDSQKERFTNCDEANQYLSYEYRAPWKLS
ncbi:MAG: Gfo/Idh/MocA family oxidoreductase, partial [Planctomycetia bacterium]|nr:Gfo/Idh/MocA family oxidoreductase [Planctomycetia bacterium]